MTTFHTNTRSALLQRAIHEQARAEALREAWRATSPTTAENHAFDAGALWPCMTLLKTSGLHQASLHAIAAIIQCVAQLNDEGTSS